MHCHADEYASGARVKTLQAHGLAHDDLSDAKLFLACADQFVRIYEGKNRSNSMLRHSKMLLDMLQRNAASYRATSQTEWADTSYAIFTKPILVTATITTPYTAQHAQGSPLISLQDSADYTLFRIVANAVPVTDPALGDTTQLRSSLDQPAGPQPMHVVTHLLQTARDRNQQLQNEEQSPALDKHIQEDVDKAYAFIVSTVRQYLVAGQHRELGKLTKQLAQAPWVLVQKVQKFATPYDLVFDTEEDLDHGKCCS